MLKINDTVAILAPASECDISVLEKTKALLNSWQLNYYIPEDIFASEARRAEHFCEAVLSKDIQAIWCIRGGYGSARILPYLAGLQPTQSKILIGYSDITALLLYTMQHWGWHPIHGPVASSDKTLWLNDLLFARRDKFIINNIKSLNKTNKNIITAPITGGNLSIVQTSIGTNWQIDSKNKIILLEEVAEPGYKVDRMLNHLQQAGVFANAKAIIFGDFVGDDNVTDILHDFAEKINIPVVQCPGIGHGEINYAVPFGFPIKLDLSEAMVSFNKVLLPVS